MNTKSIKQLFLYGIVGGIATVVEWAVFWLLNDKFLVWYMVATPIAFGVSTFANWFAGKILLFRDTKNVISEIIKIYTTSIIGLLLNLLIMWILIEQFALAEFISKMVATALVFAWNFIIRKVVIYKV